LIISLLLAGCQIDIPNSSTAVIGSGKVITESRSVSNFKNITFGGVGDMLITQGETESLAIEAEDNIVALIKTEVKDDTLTIGFTQNNINLRPTQPIKYTLAVKALDNLRISGAGNINIPALKTEKFTLKISGAGNVKIDKLDAADLTMTLSGAGNASVSGQVTSQSIVVTGVGNYGGRELSSQTANVLLSGAGNATVWAQKNLEAKITGFGSVNYYGSPEVTRKITGAGSVKGLGSQP
jgi:hypothetical protein